MMKGKEIMNYLNIKNEGTCTFINNEGQAIALDQIDKEGILYLLDKAIIEDDFKMDDPNKIEIKNEAHKIIYEALFKKFSELLSNRDKFIEESEGMYRTALEKYKK